MGQKNSSKKEVKEVHSDEIDSIITSEEKEILSQKPNNAKEINNEKMHLQSSLDSTLRRSSEENKKQIQKPKRSSSLSLRDYPNRKRRSNSILGEPAINPPLKKTESYNSIVKTKNPNLTTSKASISVDRVMAEWENKGLGVYSAFTNPSPKQKPTKYWVKTELQYVIMIPTVKRKRKSSLRPPPPPPPPPSEWEPHALAGKELGPQEKESFASLESKTDEFVPRSEAKPASKPKGRFCCAKRQDSG